MTAYYRQKENISHYLAFDFSISSGPCIKSEIITKGLEFFSIYLLLTLGQTAY